MPIIRVLLRLRAARRPGLFALALLLCVAVTPGEAEAKRRPDRRVAYKVTVTYTGTYDQTILAGGALFMQIHRVTTWTARSPAFLLFRHETPGGKLIGYSTRRIGGSGRAGSGTVPLVGTLHHKGTEKMNPDAPLGECWRNLTEKESYGLGPVKGQFSFATPRLGIGFTDEGKVTRNAPAVTCPPPEPDMEPQHLPAVNDQCEGCFVASTVWADYDLSDIKFGRSFTLPINWDAASVPRLRQDTPDGGFSETSHYYRLRFRPVSR